MINVPNMIAIGATGRNVGKTEFCCALIRQYTETEHVVGIKITSVDEMASAVPYKIIEENEASTNKDTARMLNAGARKVFWLRTLREQLQEAVLELLQRIPENTCIVCESTSVRSVVKPAAFIIIKSENSEAIKPSCQQLMERADRIITTDGESWDFDPDSISFKNGQWQGVKDD